MGFHLELLREGRVVQSVAVSGRLYVGRALANDLVLTDHGVSKHHALLTCSDGVLWVHDQGSTNGTFVNGDRATDPLRADDGDTIRLGEHVELRVIRGGASIERQAPPTLCDITSGVRHAFDADRLHIGSAAGCDVVVPGVAPRAATLLLHDGGEVWLGRDEEERPLALGEVFEIGERKFCLESGSVADAVTARSPVMTTYPYRVSVDLDAPGGPVATMETLDGSRHHRLSAENRAVFVYVLALRLREDRAAGRTALDAGWVGDDDLVTGVWGRRGAEKTASNFAVLLHRIRKEIEAAGFDPWCLEKRRGATRLRVDEVVV